MKLSGVLRKERERKRLSVDETASKLGLATETYEEFEQGSPEIENWAPKLAEIAIKLSTPTSRLISETGKAAQAAQEPGQCGRLIRTHRQSCGLSSEELASRLGWTPEELARIENGDSPVERYGPLMLRFSEVINQPIFNLFYPCGLPYSELNDYP